MRSAAAGLILAAVTASASPDVPTASASQSEAQTVSEVAAVSGATFNLSEVRAMHFREDTGVEGVSRLEASTTIGPDDFVFAVEETDRNESYIRMLASLAEGLRVAFPDRRTHIRQIPSRGFIDVVRAEKIPFVFATAGTMVALVNESGAVPLAARERLNSHAEESSQSAAGGLLVVDAKRRDLGSLESLEGARIAVESSVSFGPWQWLAGRLLADHHDPRKFFSEAVWRPHDVPEVLNAVLSGRADAGLISVCTFEALAAEGIRSQSLSSGSSTKTNAGRVFIEHTALPRLDAWIHGVGGRGSGSPSGCRCLQLARERRLALGAARGSVERTQLNGSAPFRALQLFG